MAQYSNLKAYIEEKIYENGTQAITGDILQDVLKVMTDDLGEFYQTGGVASPSTDPGTPDAKVIYFATEAGTYTNFGNIELAAGEVALLIFDTSWVKETLNVLSSANGGVKTANLADGAVTTAKIANGAVEEGKIADASVTSGKLGSGAVTTEKIADGAATTDKIANKAVATGKLGDKAVTTGKIADSAVGTTQVANEAITEGKIADEAVTAGKIADGAVTNGKINDGAVTEGKIGSGAVTTGKIGAKAVTTGKIADKAVTSGQLGDKAVTSDKIADGAVGSDQLAEGAFSAQNLADGSVTTDKLADDAVTAEKIADGAVTAGKFANGSVTTIKLGSGAVTTEKIGDGMVTRQKLADSSVGTSKIIDGAVTTDKVADGAITDAKLENPVSVSQNTETGGWELKIGGEKVAEVSDFYNVNAYNHSSSVYRFAQVARNSVPSNLRKIGMAIAYLSEYGWTIEQYIGEDISGWANQSNWQNILDNVERSVGIFQKNFNAVANFAINAVIANCAMKQGQKLAIKIEGTAGIVANTIVFRKSDNTNISSAYYGYSKGNYVVTLNGDTDYISIVISGTNITSNGTLKVTVINNETYFKVAELETSVNALTPRVSAVESSVETLEGAVGNLSDYLNIYQNESVTASAYLTKNIYGPFLAGHKYTIKVIDADGCINDNIASIVLRYDDNTDIDIIHANTDNQYTLSQNASYLIFKVSSANMVSSGTIAISIVGEKSLEVEEIRNFYNQTGTKIGNFCKTIGKTPMASWVDDDGTTNNEGQDIQGIILPVAQDLSVPVTFGVINLDGSAPYQEEAMTKVDFFKLMQTRGYQITSHPIHAHWYGQDYDLSKVEPELLDNLGLLRDNGFFHYDMLIYPGSSSDNADIVNIVRKWCVCGVTAGRGINHLGTNTKWQIKRLFISLNSTYNVTWYKNKIDEAYLAGDWIVFGSHSWEFTQSDDTSDESAMTRGNLKQILQYAKTKGFNFYTLWDAYNRRHWLFDAVEINQ